MLLSSKLIVVFVTMLAQGPAPRAPRKAPPAPYASFRVATDNVPQAQIAGVVLRATGKPKGTLFLMHGFTRSKEDLYGWDWVRNREGWNLVPFDFREHGQSSRTVGICTLGYHEIWDVKAVVDYAESRGLEKPYAFYGISMGASVATRWAAQDSRIAGVFAVSPYPSGVEAVRQFIADRLRLRFVLDEIQPGLRAMMEAIDLPKSVAQRNDLRLWVMCGDRDFWRVSDERAIVTASASPTSMKHLYVIPGGTHNSLWRWKGNRLIPSHDQLVRDFLTQCRQPPAGAAKQRRP